jgi:hypothetical protein
MVFLPDEYARTSVVASPAVYEARQHSVRNLELCRELRAHCGPTNGPASISA